MHQPSYSKYFARNILNILFKKKHIFPTFNFNNCKPKIACTSNKQQ